MQYNREIIHRFDKAKLEGIPENILKQNCWRKIMSMLFCYTNANFILYVIVIALDFA